MDEADQTNGECYKIQNIFMVFMDLYNVKVKL